ncbi:MAG: hypothetical protein JWO67_4297 [Streptosporangiaceae bacterium]|jgi:hypothetical protein|nr:hypothetical protein [Streptosporangiaceae bacterium]
MRHGRDGAATAVNAASQILVARGKYEPQERDNPEVTWGARASEGVWVPTKDGQHIHIRIDCPAADPAATVLRPSLRVFVGIETDTDIVAQTTGNGVRLLTVVHGPNAPTEFRFPVSLADGLSLEAMPSGGFDVVHTRFGATVGRFYSPWACDTMFRHVKAEYRLDGGAIVLRVPHEDAAYPVLVDPLYAR